MIEDEQEMTFVKNATEDGRNKNMNIKDTPEEMEKEIKEENLDYEVIEFSHGSVRFDIPLSQILKLNIDFDIDIKTCKAEVFIFRDVPRWYFWLPRFIQDCILKFFEPYIGILYDIENVSR